MMIRTIALTALALSLTFGMHTSHAAPTFLSADPEPRLTAAPAFPSPNSTVRVSLESYGLNARGATISWSVDGEKRPEQANERSISVNLGGAGSKTVVTAEYTPPGGTLKSYTLTLIPGDVDLIVEPDTHVPEGYMGRPLASAESGVRVVAVPHIIEAGKRIPTKDLLFTWEVNGTVLYGGAVLGRESIVATLPRFGNGSVTVTVEKRDGTRAVRATSPLSATKPLVRFYEESTLFGTILHTPDIFLAPKEEIAIRAEPFYISKNTLLNNSLMYTWTINGTRVENTSSDPRSILLRRTAGDASARVGFTYAGNGQSLQYGSGSFNIMFTDEDLLSL